MKPSKRKPVSLGDIAAEAGVSRMSVSSALRNRPGLSQATRKRILRIAKRLNYIPDPRVATLMTGIRETKTKGLLPMAWINVGDKIGLWKECDFLKPYYDGAAKRCRDSGYQLVEFQLNHKEMSNARLSQILYQRGIQGLIIAPPRNLSIIHLRLNWEHFAAVSFERALAAPSVHQAVQNSYFNILLSMKKVMRAGYSRIGVFLASQTNRRGNHICEAAVKYFQSGIARAERIPPFINLEPGIPKAFRQWIERYTPDVILGGHSGLCEGLRELGLRVPEDIGVVHLSLDGDCDDWCGIKANKSEIGATTADTIISLIQNNQFGLPKFARETLINGTWQTGTTLLIPKPRVPGLIRSTISLSPPPGKGLWPRKIANFPMKTFLTPGTLSIGANYWASHAGPFMWRDWQPGVIEQDFSTLAGNGFGLLRVFPLWPDFQPLHNLLTHGGGIFEIRHDETALSPNGTLPPNGVSVEMVDRLVTLADFAHRQGLQLIVGLITGWMSGRLFVPPALEGMNPITDPRSILWQVRLIQVIVRRLKDHPAIQAWDLGNECNVMGEASREQAWLWTATLAQTIRCIDPEKPVISGMHSLSANPEKPWAIRDQGELTDILTTHPYPLFTPHCHQEPVNTLRPLLHATAESCLYSDLSGRPTIVEEFGTLGPMVASEAVAAEVMRNTLLNAWTHDLRAGLWWCAFDQLQIEQAPHDWLALERELGLFRQNGESKPTVTAAQAVRALIDALPIKELPPRRIDAVCILTRGQDHWGVAYSAFILAKQAGFDLKFAYADQPLPTTQLYLLPSLKEMAALTASQEKKLWEKVASGATVYLSLDNTLISGFSKKIGLEVVTRHHHSRICSFSFEGTSFEIPTSVEWSMKSVGAEILAEEPNGNPVFSKARYGQGTVYFLGVPIEAILASQEEAFSPGKGQSLWALYRKVAEDILALRKVRKTSPLLGITEHENRDGSWVVVMVNYSPDLLIDTLTLAEGWKLAAAWAGPAPAWKNRVTAIELAPHACLIWHLAPSHRPIS